jgi:phage shock protein PspC (stress-responsive transcriptional regulator)
MKRLTKDTKNAMLFGVCAGLSNYTGIDASILRILTVLGVVFSFSIIFWIYILLALILPNQE